MPSAVIFIWTHHLDAVAGPGQGLGNALSALGYNVNILNANDQAMLDNAYSSELRNCDIAIAMGAPPLSKIVNGSRLFDAFGKIFFLYSLDALFYDLVRVPGVVEFVDRARSSPKHRILVPNRENCDIINELCTGSCSYLAFSGPFFPIKRYAADRQSRIVVIGTMGQELASLQNYTKFIDLVQDAPPELPKERLLKFANEIESPGTPTNIMFLARNYLNISSEVIFTPNVAAYLARLDAFQKRRRRHLAILGLRQFPVDFYGEGWEAYTTDFKDCRHMGTVPHSDIGRVLQQYKILLNFDPNWDDGLHDRVYSALANGCRVLTNRSAALVDLELPDEGSVLTYEADRPTLSHSIENLFSHDLMPTADILKFRERNSWLARIDSFLSDEIAS
jgi:hypothetical protein